MKTGNGLGGSSDFSGSAGNSSEEVFVLCFKVGCFCVSERECVSLRCRRNCLFYDGEGWGGGLGQREAGG